MKLKWEYGLKHFIFADESGVVFIPQEIFEDVVHSVNSMPFVEAIIERANTIYDEAKKKSVLSEAEYARMILEDSDNP